MNDYEISKQFSLKNIQDIALKYNITSDNLELYGNYKAKIDYQKIKNSNKGKLILVTSTSPTKFGEGKTTLAIALNDALNALDYKSIAVLREPSLGPVFGIKGGACGAGKSQIAPMEDINLHFTGDIHAVESANNLLAAIIDNHLYQGNDLNLDLETINFKRCIDINDRALRNIQLSNRKESFNITTASEIMAILCLSKDMNDLKKRLGNIFIGYTKDKKPIFAKDLNCVGALALLLKDALKPNIVQSLENNLVLVHGGPFANIAHGCSSVISINTSLALADYTITEAGFGSDMGGLKFFDIVARNNNLIPDVVVINTTVRGLKYNGNNILEKGLCNLEYHVQNIQKFSNNIIVIINKFETDTKEEIEMVLNKCQELNVLADVSNAFIEGSKGVLTSAQKIIKLATQESKDFKLPYSLDLPLIDKIKILCTKYLNAKDVIIDSKIQNKFDQINNTFPNLAICIAKNQYSISDNKQLLGNPKDFIMRITDINVANGAGFITVCMGNIMTMPGLGKNSNYLNMDIVDDHIVGLS